MEEELLIEETPVEEIVIDVPIVKRKRKSKKEAFKDAVIKRFSSAPWEKKRTVTLGGAGGIGSNLAYNLIKLGYDIVLFEDDVVEAHNIGGQMFYLSDVGGTKALAIMKRAGDVNKETKILPVGRLTEESSDVFIYPIVLVGFDSIEARKILFEKWYAKYKNSSEAILIESRQNAEDFEIFAVTPDRADRYRATLFTEEIDELPCNYKATTQTGLINAGMMIGLMTNFISELVDPGIREIPFRTEFNIPMMYHEITK